MFSGDEVAHALDKIADNNTRIERALQTMKVASNSISNTFPNIPFLASFGNNDLLGNYLLPVDKGYYESVLKIWQPLILCEKCKLKVTTEEELRKTFLVGGFYKAEIKGKLPWFYLTIESWHLLVCTLPDPQLKMAFDMPYAIFIELRGPSRYFLW